MGGLRDMLMRAKGASSVSHRSVIERQEELNKLGLVPLPYLPDNEDALAAQAEVDRIKQATAHLITPEKPAAKPRKRQAAKKVATEPQPVPVSQPVSNLPRTSIIYVIDGVGEFENTVDSVIVDEQVLSVWDSSDQAAPAGKFRAQRGLELVIHAHDQEYLVWSPGVHIWNEELRQTVSVYLLK